ncbi:MAG: flippase [Patescibacteria group bacterium]|nr:flippase [Patescibacteria group bacterium]
MAEGRVAKNTAYLLSAFVGQKVLAFAYFILVARLIGAEGTGKYFIAVSFTTIFSVFIDLGLSNVLVREVAKCPENAGKLLSNVLGMKAVLASVTVAAALVTARLLGYGADIQMMIAMASAVMVLDSIHLVLYATMRGLQNLRYEAIGVVTGQAVTIVTGTIFLLMRLPLVFLVVALFCGSSWNVLFAGWSVRRRFHVPFALRLEPALIRFFWGVTIPFALAGIFSRVYSYIDTVMLSRLATVKAVGYYAVAYKLTFAFQFLPMAFAAAVYPAMSEAYVKDHERLARIFVIALKYLAAAAAPVTAGIFVLAGALIRLVYGPAYAEAVLPLQILILSLAPAFLYWPAGSLLNACDRQAHNTVVMGVTMLTNVVLNAFLIPRFGPVGAAAAALVGNTLLFVGAFVAATRVVRIDGRAVVSVFAKVFGSAFLMALVLWPWRNSVSVFILIPLGALTYATALFVTRAFTVAEAKAAANVFLRRGRGVSDLMS